MIVSNIKSQKEYLLFYDNNKNKIPKEPSQVYKNEWISWDDFLNKNVEKFVNYDVAKKMVSKFNIKSYKEWVIFIKSGQKPHEIPNKPNTYYTRRDTWISWGEFLQTNIVSSSKMIYLPYEEAKKFALKLNLVSMNEWIFYVKNNKLPSNIPKTPNDVYKNKGWVNYADFLGFKFKQMSSYEKRIEIYLIENNIVYKKQKTFPTCKYKSLLKFDFYLDEYNILIEYDGEQHFKPISVFGGLEGFERTKQSDNIKNEWCLNNNIHLLRIPFYDRENIYNILNDYLAIKK
jgi:hypothetical protein